jgi:hypothetical protein
MKRDELYHLRPTADGDTDGFTCAYCDEYVGMLEYHECAPVDQRIDRGDSTSEAEGSTPSRRATPDPLISPVFGAVLDALHKAGIHPSCGSAGTAYGLPDGATPVGIEVILFYSTEAAQGIAAGTDETPKAAQPEGREPGPKDAPKPSQEDPE